MKTIGLQQQVLLGPPNKFYWTKIFQRDLTPTWHCFARQSSSTRGSFLAACRVVWCQGCDLRTVAHTLKLNTCLIECSLNSNWIHPMRPIMIFKTTFGKRMFKKRELNVRKCWHPFFCKLNCPVVHRKKATSCWFVYF